MAFAVEALAEMMVKEGHEVLVLCRTPRKDLVQDIRDGVHLHRMPLAWSDARMAESLIATAADFKPNLLQVHLLTGLHFQAVLKTAEACRCPLIHYLHIYSLICRANTLFRDGRSCTWLCPPCRRHAQAMQNYTAKVDGVVAVSRGVLDWHLKAGQFAGIPQAVIPNAAPRKALRSARNHHGRPVLGFLGRIAPTKGLAWLLQVARELGLPVKVAGTGPEMLMHRLQQEFAGELVEFCGWVDADEFLPTIDALVVPSLWEEPLGRVALEALSHGVPIVASRVGGLADLLVDGVNGWGIHPHEPESLAIALKKLCEHPVLDPTTVQETMRAYVPEKICAQVATFDRQIIGV